MKRMWTTGTRLCAMVIALVAASGAPAQTYPSKPLRIVVGFPPGGGTDAVARLLGPKLTELLGQSAIIDNRPGAETNLANEYVARATPDGYTLLLTTGAIAINMSLYDKVEYDAIRDFAPISLIAASPLVVAVGPALPVKTLKELLQAAQARPGQLNYSSAGGPQRLAAELFKVRTKTDIVNVPYKGSGPAITALIGDEVQLSFSNIPTVIQQAKASRLRVLGVAARARSALMPDVPTLQEQGVDMDAAVWYGVLAPAATPKAVVRRLSQATETALRAHDVRERLMNMGAEPVGSTPDVFAKQLRVEVKQWAEVVRLSGAKAN